MRRVYDITPYFIGKDNQIMFAGQFPESHQLPFGKDLARWIQRITKTDQSRLPGDQLLQPPEIHRRIPWRDRKRHRPRGRRLDGITEKKIDGIEDDGFVIGGKKGLT